MNDTGRPRAEANPRALAAAHRELLCLASELIRDQPSANTARSCARRIANAVVQLGEQVAEERR